MMRFNIESLITVKEDGLWEVDKEGLNCMMQYIEGHRGEYPSLSGIPDDTGLTIQVTRGVKAIVLAMNQLRRGDPVTHPLSPDNWEITIGHERYSSQLKVINDERRYDKQKPIHHYFTAVAVSEIIGDTMPTIPLPTRGKTDVETQQQPQTHSARILPFRAGKEGRDKA